MSEVCTAIFEVIFLTKSSTRDFTVDNVLANLDVARIKPLLDNTIEEHARSGTENVLEADLLTCLNA
eukprot:3407283-Amphidinium_carterae.1